MRALAVVCAVMCMLSVCSSSSSAQSASGLLGKEDQRIDGKCKFLVANVETLDGCMCYLLDHADEIDAVSYDHSTAKCIAAPHNGNYTIVYAAGWITYTIEKGANSTNPSSYVIFTRSTYWKVPDDVYNVRALCIGGGGGGLDGPYGGSGSGFISFGSFSTHPGLEIYVKIGAGGSNGESAQSSSIDGWLVAYGGNSGDYIHGGSGGSGGGASNADSYNASRGGSAGNDGQGIYGSGGSGQGSWYWSEAVATIKSVEIRFGDAGEVSQQVPSSYAGGSGAGGLIVNGQYVTAGDGHVPNYSGHGGVGYGAGGGGSGCTGDDNNHRNGDGAQGICIIEW